MVKKTTYIILCCLFILNTGCRRKMVEFTPAEKERIESTGVDLSRIQYYNSDEIVLSRVIESTDIRAARGIVISKNGKYIDQVKISKNTLGILIKREGTDKMWIAFEKGPLQYLPFEKPKYYGNYFRLSSSRIENGKSFVEYDGVEYQIIGKSRLLYRQIERNKINNDHRSAKGMRVDNSFFNLDIKLKKNKNKKNNKKGVEDKKETPKKNNRINKNKTKNKRIDKNKEEKTTKNKSSKKNKKPKGKKDDKNKINKAIKNKRINPKINSHE